ncbi:MAG: NUDIX hydrolase N-terminal domain-containing protein [Pseudomonadales bacterium]|nr:NUDIX hydrolase N-terminal domain-containing protein [Pseudomonadales bacterium]MCP5184907.1 NUDIX hydrolase N-terminal domain-containing protein [Pseudomonadales bacterium]
MEDPWLFFAKRLLAIGSTGEYFTAHAYDRERYEEVSAIARQMLSLLAGSSVERIASLFPDHATGYATPRVDVRGAVVRNDQVLLVRERSDGLWTLPGGYAETGLTLAANVLKEIEEEAGIVASVECLLGVRHKASHAYDPDVRDFYKVFFLCRAAEDVVPTAGLETLDARFFSANALPPLSRGRTLEKDIHVALARSQSSDLAAFFD